MERQYRQWLAIAAILFVILISACYGVIFQHYYPEIRLSQTQLYGENGENLKDFDLSEDGLLTATSDDPWITVSLESAIPVASIQVHASAVDDLGGDFVLFDTDSWQYTWKTLRDGNNIYQIYDNDNLWMTQNYRLDMVSVNGASCRVESVTLNPALTVWLLGWVRCAVPAAIIALAGYVLILAVSWFHCNYAAFLKWGVRQFVSSYQHLFTLVRHTLSCETCAPRSAVSVWPYPA